MMNKWQKEVIQSQLKDEKQVLKNIEGVYKKALDDVNDKIAALMGRTDTENLQSIIYQVEYQKALKQQINGILDELHSEEFTTVSDYLTKAYDEGYLGTMYDLQKQGVPLVLPIDQEQVVKAVVTDSKISKGLYEHMGEDVTVLKRRIANNVSRGIAQGSSYAQIAKNIKGLTNVPMKNAFRIARTEGHRIQNSAAFDAQRKAKEKGADVVKQWDSTLDGRTRPTHRELDGQIRELEEPFEVAGHEAMFPGDFGIASEDCNCRCALLQRARWALGEGFTKYDNFTGELREFATPKDYDEFKKWYFSDDNVSYMNYIETLEKRHKTKDFTKLLESTNDVEYKKFKILEAKSPFFNGATEKVAVEYSKNEAREMVWKNWDEYREKFVGHAVKISDVDLNNDFMYDTVNLSVLPTKTQTEVFQTIESLEEKYYSPLTKISVMDSQEAAFSSTTYAYVQHQWGIASCEMKFNPVKLKNTERLYELSQSGYSIAYEKGKEIEYVVTHEFGHSIIDLSEKLPSKSQNFVDVDFTSIKKARKELEAIHKEYAEELAKAQSEYDAIRRPIEEKMLFGTGEVTDADRLAIKTAKDKVDNIYISRYANSNSDEFVAEAFADSEIGINPSEYSIRVGEVINKYFRKG